MSNDVSRVDLLTANVQDLIVNTGAGDDDTTINEPQPYVNIDVNSGQPDNGSDVLTVVGAAGTPEAAVIAPSTANTTNQTIMGYSAPITVSGTERIEIVGQAADPDTLNVNLGAGDNTARVEGGPNLAGSAADVITSDSLPNIAFTGLANFTATGGSGADVVTFAPWFLAGASLDYRFNGGVADTLVIEGTDGATLTGGDDRFTVSNPEMGIFPVDPPVQVTALRGTLAVVTAINLDLSRLQINGLGGDDWVTVDVDAADSDLISVPITFDGGGGSDLLIVEGTPATTVTTTTYRPGPDVTEGRLTYDTNMTIDFLNLEPVVDLSAAGSLVVEGTDADNAINYVVGTFTGPPANPINPDGLITGMVSVDAFETIEFANKANLTLNGNAGDDKISLNYGDTPDALTGITVNGNNPTVSDTVVVNGTSAADAILVNTLTNDGAVITGAQPVPVTVTTAEHLVIDGQGGTDTLTVETPDGNDQVTLYPGSTPDTGDLTFRRSPGDTLLPVHYEDIGSLGTLVLSDENGGREDDFTFNGRTPANAAELFVVLASGDGSAQLFDTTSGIGSGHFLSVVVSTPGVDELRLNGLAGDDSFQIPGNHPYASGVVIDGGESGGRNELFFRGTGTAVTVDLEVVPQFTPTFATVTQAGFGSVFTRGVDLASVRTVGGDLTVIATPGDDTITVTPTGTDSAITSVAGVIPVIDGSGIGSFTVDADAGNDTVRVVANEGTNAIAVSDAAVTVDALETVNLATANLEALEVSGEQGDDTLTVTPSATVPIFIDGGDPIGAVGDTLALIANDTSMFWPGPEGDAGGFDIDGLETVSYDHIERLTVTDPVGNDLVATVMGTQDDDDITAQGQAVNNVDVTVNDGPVASYIGVGTLTLLGKNGDDDFTTDINVAALAVTINVDGGLPTAGSDELRVTGVAGTADTPSWTPNTVDSGILQLAGQSPLNVTFIEHLIYDGEADDDTLTVVGNAATNDTFTHAPGADLDAGRVSIHNSSDTLLGINYEDLGLAGMVSASGLAGSDTLVALGTGLDDIMSTAATTGAVDLERVAGHQVLLTNTAVEILTLEGQDGTDTFNVNAVHPFTRINVDGGGPDTDDMLNLNDSAGRTATIVVDLANSTVAGFGSVAGELVSFHGLEQVTMQGVDGADTLLVNGSSIDDLLTYTPNGPQAGRFQSDNHPSLFVFEDIAGTFTVDLLSDSGDEVAIEGTRNSDTITVDSPNRTLTVENAAGVVLKPVALADTVEIATVLARGGSDTIVVVPAVPVASGVAGGPAGTTKPINLQVNVDGGDSSPADSLVIAADATGTPLDNATHFVIVNHSRQVDEGVVRIFQDAAGAGNDPTQLPDITFVDVHHVAPLLQGVTANQRPNLLILGADLFEENEFLGTAAMLGSEQRLNVENLAIFPNAAEVRFAPADQDWFRVVAEQNGTLDVQAYFQQYDPEVLPGGGDLQLEVYDIGGNLISGFGTNESATTDRDERVRIPAVAGQTYFVRVIGADDAVVNGYDLVILNEPPTVPYDIELDDLPVDNGYNCTVNPPSGLNSDTGRSHFDNITCDAQPAIIFRLDDAILLQDIQGNDGTVFTNNPPDEQIPIPFNGSNANGDTTAGYRVAIFLEGAPQQPANEPQVPVGYAEQTAEPGVYTFDFGAANNGAGLTLTDGSHFINAKVQIIDPSNATQTGFGARSQSLEIIVDTVAPPVFFGLQSQALDGLHADSDTGNPIMESTFSDRITSDRTPTFWGLAEANVNVRLFVDMNGNGTIQPGTDVFIGETVATPFDGNNQFGNAVGDHPNGQWEVTSVVNLNDPALGFAKDGLRSILVDAEDVAGNFGGPQVLDIFLDTQGPRIFDPAGAEPAAFITGQPDYDLFDPKPSVNGPTPLARSITVNIEDLPIRVPGNPASFLYPALKTPVNTVDPATGLLIDGDGNAATPNGQSPLEPGYFEVRGDYNGVIPIETVVFQSDQVNNGEVATGEIIFTFFEPLPDDRFTLTIRDNLTDHPGNNLDGEMDTIEPQDSPTLEFPSGDLIPGGDFVARFTIDSRPEVGVWAAGSVWVDINGNETIDSRNADFVNRDIIYTFGNGNFNLGDRALTSDDFFAGNFVAAAGGTADGFDKLAVYGSTGQTIAGPWRWLIDTDNDGVPNINVSEPRNINGLPVAGNFDNNATNGDEVGLFDGTSFWLDTDHDFQVDTQIVTSLRGFPIVGDFDGDDSDDLGTWNDDQFMFDLANDGFGQNDLNGDLDAVINFGFIGVRERPVAADMDQDGIDDIGLWTPDRAGVTPLSGAEWYFLVSNDPNGANRVTGTVNTLNHAFEPIPFGRDLYIQLGDDFAIPIIGNFDPPIRPENEGGNDDPPSDDNPLDTNKDGSVSPLDALVVTNYVNDNGTTEVLTQIQRNLDANRDNFISPLDALVIINYLNGGGGGAGEGEGSAVFNTADIASQAAPEAVVNQLSFTELAIPDVARFQLPQTTTDAVFARTSPATAKSSERTVESTDLLFNSETEPSFVVDETLKSASFDLDDLLASDDLFDELAGDILDIKAKRNA